jgi:UDP-GlcNAc:undecaprenyl-phosphate GlcNAc-1-phosphate transferase
MDPAVAIDGSTRVRSAAHRWQIRSRLEWCALPGGGPPAWRTIMDVLSSPAAFWWRPLGVGMAAAAATALALAAARRFLPAARFLDLPGDPLQVHTRPIPRLGGVGIFAALLVVGSARRWADDPLLARALLPGAAIFALGCADDALHLPARLRLAVQLAAGFLAAALGFRFPGLPPPVDVAAAALLLAGCANALNWLDGVDGLAGCVAATGAALLAVAFHGTGMQALCDLHAALCGALLVFLAHNVSRGSRQVFLGDAGSMGCGFLLALSALALGRVAPGPSRFAPWLFLAVPLAEFGSTILRRALRRRPLLEGDREHLYDRLLRRGVPWRRVLLLHWSAALAAGIVALRLLEA